MIFLLPYAVNTKIHSILLALGLCTTQSSVLHSMENPNNNSHSLNVLQKINKLSEGEKLVSLIVQLHMAQPDKAPFWERQVVQCIVNQKSELINQASKTPFAFGHTPLTLAAHCGLSKIVSWLLIYGADPLACIDGGWTAFGIAMKQGEECDRLGISIDHYEKCVTMMLETIKKRR